MSRLQPPRIHTDDAGTRDVSESSDEHFSSASEGDTTSNRPSSDLAPQSPIPITRVERVDDKAAHGEVPGTPAYQLRTQDAVPDEVEIVPEGRRARSGTQSRSRASSMLDATSRPQTPGGSPVPRTVVDRVDDKPSHGEVAGTLAKEMRMADATPDEVRTPVRGTAASSGGSEVEQAPEDRQAWFRSMWEKPDEQPPAEDEVENNEGDDFGDDFDDFAEGNGDDFGDFDEAGGEVTPLAESAPQTSAQTSTTSILDSLPPLDPDLDRPGVNLDKTMLPYLEAIFPDSPSITSDTPSPDFSNCSSFLTDRSLSLWQQLVQPPPMQPPNWTRSRIRRLFLVSLGVPVDLDEILPPSKQKRLVLPNINLSSPQVSTIALERLRQADINDSTTSIDSKTHASRRSKRVKGPSPPPDFDANSAALICRTTPEALNGLDDIEIKCHVSTLELLNRKASTVLEYWLQRKDEAVKEKEALEGVIENLVGFVKGRRGK